MADVNQILGKLIAQAETAQRQRSELFEQVRELRKITVKRDEFRRFEVETEEALLDYKTTKAKIYGMIAVLTVLAGGLWEVGKSLLG